MEGDNIFSQTLKDTKAKLKKNLELFNENIRKVSGK